MGDGEGASGRDRRGVYRKRASGEDGRPRWGVMGPGGKVGNGGWGRGFSNLSLLFLFSFFVFFVFL